MDSYAHCEALVRAADKERFLAGLFAPADKRRHLYALYAFNAEIARVREVIRTPMAGEIRLQWWRDALSDAAASRQEQEEGRALQGDVRANPVADALIATIAARSLPVEPLQALIEARSFDLYEDPMPSLDALYGYVRKTSSSLIELGALILAGRDPIATGLAGPAGIGLGLVRLMQALPAHAVRRQLYLPVELLERYGAAPNDIFAGKTTPALLAVLADLRARARLELDQVSPSHGRLGTEVLPAFLPVALARPLLARLEAQAANPFAALAIPQWRQQWTLWRAAKRGL